PRNQLNTNLIRNVLLLFFFASRARERLPFADYVLLQQLKISVNLLASTGLRHAERLAKQLRKMRGRLPRKHVAQLMSENARQFIFIACHRDQFSRNIDTPTRKSQRVGDWQVKEKKLHFQTGRRCLCKKLLSRSLDVTRQVFVINDQIISLYLF